jgi:hypothetical protein
MRHGLLLLLFGVCVAQPSPTDILKDLWTAARNRVRQMKETQAKDASYQPTNAEMFASLLDYAHDKIQHPPLLQVERNLLTLDNKIREMMLLVEYLARQSDCAGELAATRAALADPLVPVQPNRSTIIPS